MSTGSSSDAAMRLCVPSLPSGLKRERNSAGELILITANNSSYLTVGDDEAGALDLVDGKRSLDDVVKAAIDLPAPMRPMATLSLFRRLNAAQMVQGLDKAGDLFAPDERSLPAKIARFLRILATLSFSIPLLGLPLSVGKLLPRTIWKPLRVVSIGLFALGTLGTILTGHLWELLDPFHIVHTAHKVSVEELILSLYIAAAVHMSLRDGVRGLTLASLGMPAPSATIGLLSGVLHLGINDHRRRGAAADERETLAWAGISAHCLLAALAVSAWLVAGHDYWFLHSFASASLYLALFDSAPYGRGDVWHLIGIRTRIPNLSQRSAVFLFKRSIKNLTRSEPIRRAEETYLWLAMMWLAHWILSLSLITTFLVPGALETVTKIVLSHDWRDSTDFISGGLAVVFAGVLLLALFLLGLGLIAVIFSAAMQVMRPEKSTPPQSSERIGDGADELVEEMQRVPFLASMPAEDLSGLIAGMRREKYGVGAVVVRQGEEGDRFCFLHAGECQVEFEEESGLVHKVATLRDGDFFGEIALLDNVARTATVRTLTDTEVYSLDRETFVALVERSSFARDAVLDQVRNAAFLRTVPVFQTLSARLMSALLAGVEVVRETTGVTIVAEGDRGDAMYVIREGSCDVVRDVEGTEDHISTLTAGDWFGEIALLHGIKRTATVRTTADAVLVRVPGGVLDSVLLEDFQIGMALERAMAQRLVALESR